ncbi:hypothetical protein BDN72DRAFT_843485 [Pluteus cervinus]|uniref:Uncharacterized protein n=1 Tax=Pluteus cervinus TaxID=181527 RepID=A0ACD3AP61_9AGAR|nr:hypothetical protein BDN72DRAFT_843485 [Pluteus cervinus]
MPSIISTIGALEIGVFMSTFLFGIATVQAYIYYRRFPKDGWLIKSLVGMIWVLELGHSICVSHGLFEMTLSQYKSPRPGSDRDIEPSFAIAVLFSGCIASLTQAYFACRLRVLSEKWAIPILFWILALARFVAWIYAGSVGIQDCMRFRNGESDHLDWQWPLVPLLAFGACVDFIVAAMLFYHLYRTQREVLLNTARLLDKLIIWTIQNGFITSFAGVATCIALHVQPDSFVWIAVFMLLTRLFSNSFLASLNARVDLLRQSQGTINSPLSLRLSFASNTPPHSTHLHDSRV